MQGFFTEILAESMASMKRAIEGCIHHSWLVKTANQLVGQDWLVKLVAASVNSLCASASPFSV